MTQKGFYHHDASGRLCYEMDWVNAEGYFEMIKKLEERFVLESGDPPVLGPDQTIWTVVVEGSEIDICWDIWSGFFVTALNADAEQTVRTIGSFLDDGI